ncbi:MAG TPA: 2-oxoacid:acceptor oxidoreductase family protein [Streptosporangiaceae bacterium]|nr:2-oxoacid:acceptor oxidoreductase family protein [Streptosporangiaceae bacterium]
MFEIRIHGRGGQGVVTAAELLSAAAFTEGKYAQAFPSFGSERTGAPVVSFCRFDDRPIRVREPVMHPDVLIIQDPTLLHQVNLFEGTGPAALLLINSGRPPAELGIGEFTGQLAADAVLSVPATELAQLHVGRPVPNAALLGGFAALTGAVSIESVEAAIRDRFAGQVGEGNVAAARAAYDSALAQLGHGSRLPSVALGRAGSGRQDGSAGQHGPAGRPSSTGGRIGQIEGSRGVADAVALGRPEVICAYPISPQTHIVEALATKVKSGELSPCEFVNVESEFAAMSVAIGASAAGARAYTATASQGLLYMAEALYNASGLGLPIVMTVANRAIGAPINIWNDHSDAMSQRDCGWIQLYAETNQEALDLHIQAFRIAEEVSLPVMVCMDGFVLTHAHERLEIPGQEQVDRFLPAYEPRQVLDPDDPVSIGAMVGPEAFTEVRYLAHARQSQALELIPDVAAAFAGEFGRDSGGLVRHYRTQDADTIVIALGSVLGTIKDTIDELRAGGMRIGVLGITSFRPFPLAAVRDALAACRRVVVLERALAVGIGGIVSANVRMALAESPQGHAPVPAGRHPHSYTVIAGLGGRAITKASLRDLFTKAAADDLEPLTFLDLNTGLIDRELSRAAATRRSGPAAENILRDLGAVASRIG